MQNLVVVQHQLNFHKEQRIKTQNGIKQSEYFENRLQTGISWGIIVLQDLNIPNIRPQKW